MTMEPRLAVFDVDGTLVDSQHHIVAAVAASCRAFGLSDVPRPEAIRRIIGLSLVEAIAKLMPQLPADDHVRLAHLYKEAFTELRRTQHPESDLFPGARETLAALNEAGWLLGLATGKSRRGVAAMFERHGFAGWFVTAQTADDNPSKPAPGMLLRAMAEAGVGSEATVMIGDTVYDIAMARSAAVRAVGVAWGNHEADELAAAGAHRIADDFATMPALLEGLVAPPRAVLAPV